MRLLVPALLLLALPFAAHADAAAEAELAAHSYRLEHPKELKLKAGERGKLHLAIVPEKGAHVSPDAPVSLTAVAAAPFELVKAKLGREDSHSTAAQGIEFDLPVLGKGPGSGELKAQLTFYICVEKLCARQKRELVVAVRVE